MKNLFVQAECAVKDFLKKTWNAFKSERGVAALGRRVKAFFKKYFTNKKTVFGASVLLFFVVVAFVGPMVFPYDAATDSTKKYLDISWAHPLGTDWLGRDVFRQMIAGTQSMLEISFYSGLITVLFGTFLGILSGYVGGWVDKMIMAVTNVFLCIPVFPIYLVLAALIKVNTSWAFALLIAVFSWAGLCRAIRIQIVSLKERDFIQICKVMGMGRLHIIFRELLPNVMSFVIINFILTMRGAIMASIGIMLVGLASYDPTNWGAIMTAARGYGFVNFKNVLILLYPLIAITIMQLATLNLANGLDETLNPRLKVL